MPDIHWIKMATAMWEDEKVTVLSSRSDGDSIMMVWCRLMCLAGKCNDCGRIYLAPGIAYSDETLSNVFHRPASLIRQSLKAFEELGMVTLHGNGVIELVNWAKYQSVDGMERTREKGRLRVEKHRKMKEQRLLQENVTLRNVTVTVLDSDSDSELKNTRVQKKPSEKKPPVEGHAEFVAEVHTLSGGKYVFNKQKDFGMIKTLLGKLGKDESIGRLRAYYQKDHWFTKEGRSLSGFILHVNEIAAPPKKPEPKVELCPKCGRKLLGGICDQDCGYMKGDSG